MPVIHSGKKTYSTKEACEQIGRSKNAILAWIKKKEITDVKNDTRGYRSWTEEDIRRFCKHRDLVRNREDDRRKNWRKL